MKNYELIMQILDKSEEKNVPVDIAYDMLAVDGDRDALKEAYEILDKNYKAITALRNIGKTDEIETICMLSESGETEAVKDHIQKLIDDGIIEE